MKRWEPGRGVTFDGNLSDVEGQKGAWRCRGGHEKGREGKGRELGVALYMLGRYDVVVSSITSLHMVISGLMEMEMEMESERMREMQRRRERE